MGCASQSRRNARLSRVAGLTLLLVLSWSGTSRATLFPGPDAFGYIAGEIPAALRDVRTTGTFVSLFDDQLSVSLPIGFPFDFYGLEYTTFRISSNGFITLGDAFQGSGCCSGSVVPRPFLPNNFIAAWWEDFNNPQGNIRFQTLGSPGSRELVIGFYDVAHYLNGPPVTWEIVLQEGSNAIEIQCWSCLSDGGFHTTGIENSNGTIGLQIRRGTSSAPRTGWRIAVSEAPDCSGAVAEPDTISPANGRFVPVSVAGVSHPSGDPFSIRIDDIDQDEPMTLIQDQRSADAWGIGSDQARLRAQRSAHGDGRVYHVSFTARNDLGLNCTGTVSVCVPRNQANDCIDQGPLHDSSSPPSIQSSDPEPGCVDVPRTAWIGIELNAELLGLESIVLSCNESDLPRAVTRLGPSSAVINPDGDLPAAAFCGVRFNGPQGPEEFFFTTAAGEGSATVPYDRADATAFPPFPDDYWLVDDASTPTGKRIQLEVGDLGDPLLNSIVQSISVGIGDRDGFSPIQSMMIAFAEDLDRENLPADEFASIDPLAPLGLYDMDPGSPDFGARIPFTTEVRSDVAPDGTSDHSAALFPSRRLEPAGTYALVVTRRLFAASDPGRPFAASSFFGAVAAAALPGEGPELTRARESIEPVLAFLENVPVVPVPREDVALALRVSIRSETLDPSDLIAIKEAYLAGPPPVLNVSSILPSFNRAAVLRGTVDLPIYLDPINQGLINRDPTTGAPVPSSTEAVPFVLTLPAQALAGPVPFVFYEHGHPGSPNEVLFGFNEFLDDSGYAIGGIQDVLNRRFGENPGDQLFAQFVHVLFFNSLPLFDFQSYADMMGFLRAIQGLEAQSWLPIAAPDTIPEIDPSKILFRGISYGSHYSLAFLPFAPEITAGVSVVGGGRFFEQAIHQFTPTDFQVFLPTARPTQVLSGLAAIESDSDRQDSHLLARKLYREPLAVAGQTDSTPPSLLWLEGIGDSLVTNNSTRAAADELGIPLVRPVQRATPVVPEVDAPLSENIAPGVTAGHFQYDPQNTPSCRDIFGEFEGHFCAQIALEAEAQTLHFFETALDPSRAAEIIDPFLNPPVGSEPLDSAVTRFGPPVQKGTPRCGLGFELVLLMPALLWLARRRGPGRA